MAPTEVQAGSGLAPETEQRMRELFDGHTCRRCGAPAARLCAERFYCADHFPERQSRTARLPRVRRIGVW